LGIQPRRAWDNSSPPHGPTPRCAFGATASASAVALGLAFAFRAEAIAYLLAAPWAFLFLRDAQGVRRLPDALRLSALCMALASLAAAACLVAGIDLVQLFTEFAATYRPFVETVFAPSDAQRLLLDAAAPIEHAANSGDGVFALFVSLPLLAHFESCLCY
jgi:hypothetical protein